MSAASAPVPYGGLFDLQLNGAWGVDFSTLDIDADKIAIVSANLPSTGVDAYLATLISSSYEVYAHALPLLVAAAVKSAAAGSARVEGIHLEGPFLAPERKGAHKVSHLREPGAVLATLVAAGSVPAAPPCKLCPACNTGDGYSYCNTHGNAIMAAVYGPDAVPALTAGWIKVVTLAPELKGALPFIGYLARHGVAVSVGHTTAGFDLACAAIAHGALLITHLYNAMPALGHREPGPIGLLGLPLRADAAASTTAPACFPLPEEAPFFSLIADGVHLHSAALALAYRAHPAGAVLVTDAMRAMGTAPGKQHYGDLAVEVFCGKAHVAAGADVASGGHYDGPHVVLEGTATLAGAVAPLDACVANLAKFTGCGADAARAAASTSPRALLALAASRGKELQASWR